MRFFVSFDTICSEVNTMNTRETLKINKKGHLEIGGADAVDNSSKINLVLYYSM